MHISQIQSFFLLAMRSGWASNVAELRMPHMPGYKGISFHDGDFSLLDCYCVTPNSTKSFGTTTIWHKGIPVWVMQYGGHYDESVLGLLRRALRKSYTADMFVGGRGPLVYAEDSLIYHNTPKRSDFALFSGREDIFDAENGIMLGYHEYSGMSLL